MRPAIRVEHISKRYRLGAARADNNLTESLRAAAGRLFGRFRGGPAASANEFWALKDVSFEVLPGEVVGVIGRNGAGKSTLLKVLSRIVEPTGGRAEIRGRVGSLLEVGTGFHPELTGRENVYLNGSVLGMARAEVKKKFDEIVAFAGVDRFLDTPVKRYSSGMYVRLAFAVAAHLEPEILIVDEVLAVGDAEFQKKCIEKMRAVSRSGRTVLLVSHNLAQVEGLCSRALTLQQGESLGFGPAPEQVRNYLAQARADAVAAVDLRGHPRRGDATPILTGLTLFVDGQPATVARMGGALGLELSYALPRRPRDLRIGVTLESAFGVKAATFSPTYQAPHLLDDPPAEGVIRAELPAFNLMAGTYYLNLYAQAEGLSDAVEPAGALEIETADVFGSGRVPSAQEAVCYLPCAWSRSW
ncbi:polysaccharide ABC transporter ATP-binding protein [Gemmata sp. JC673]|uniref:Polysaccharide ABC transporter ATP-binding protein n=1 Tax=Gemmata algarum TaxID=2975278 RepID=A0ABU5F6J2_9BACT|nr:polysaccharide ABC transporter ATP-binding protein [Gemmata algarum]MDY3561491.1 polysaccharide ABC transporter ATP-binding protein [Gemmata algarum]